MSHSVSRRSFMQTTGLAVAAAGLPGHLAAQPESSIALRIAHLTDVHLLPEGPSVEGFTQALRQIHAAWPKVDLIINGGDCVMDAMKADRQWAEAQWRAFTRVIAAEVSLPIVHCIGNHDVWGWGLPANDSAEASGAAEGKDMAMRSLGLSHRYYAFDRGGWHFIVLDSIHPEEHPSDQHYTGKLDDEQRNWLTQDLERTPSETPVCVVSHIPILCACEYLDGQNETSGDWVVPGAWMHIDARWLWQLFGQHPNVRLCLSGHSHQVEDLRYHGVKYLTDGAISANWWSGPYFDFPPGYVMLTLHTDGASESRFVTYG
jgi:3',5'-cyclic-AMP phosphodiesterase